MIVNYTENGWEIITQRAHGLLAAQVAMQWNIKAQPERWTETILAIAEHDDASIELEADNLLTPQGGPVNFDMKLFEADRCRRLQDLSISKSRYMALLCSLHMAFLHHKEAETNAEAKSFLKEQLKLQTQWLKELKISKKEAKRIYNLLEWCDAFSLLLCQHEVQPRNRIIEVSQGPDKRPTNYCRIKTVHSVLDPGPLKPKHLNYMLNIASSKSYSLKTAMSLKPNF